MIIVTGGAGFIGSNYVETLSRISDEPIVVCDDFGVDEKWQNIKRHLVHDIISPNELFEYLAEYAEDISLVVHMGAISTTTERDVDLIIDNNFKLSKDLYDWCVIHQTRLIYASSAATYGAGENGFGDGNTPEHLKKFVPLNGYAWSKHAFDRFVADQKRRGETMPPQCVGLKFFNVYGPNEYHKGNQMSVAWQLFHQIKSTAPAKLFKSQKEGYEDGGQLRDFIYVEDCCKVLGWLYQNPQVSGLFNVGTGKARTFKDLALSVYSAMETEPKIDYIEMPDGLADKYQYFTEAGLDNLRDAGYKEDFYSLEDGIKDYVQTYLQQADPYK